MLLGLLGLAVSLGGVLVLNTFECWFESADNPVCKHYAFLDDHNVSLSLAWIGLCVVTFPVYLSLRRQWRCLGGILLVDAMVLLLLLVLIHFWSYAPNSSYG